MNRFATLGLSLAALLTIGASPGAAEKPNVLFIAIDDLNDWVGCLGGHPEALTPNIDRLADRGMLFTRAYSVGTNCRGSRTAVMTGNWSYLPSFGPRNAEPPPGVS